MQKLSAILAMITLLFSLSPCADAWGDDDCQEHIHISQSTDGEHPEGDTCTPFCSCACCRVSVQHNDFSPVLAETSPVVLRATNTSGLISNHTFKIWQPPRA